MVETTPSWEDRTQLDWLPPTAHWNHSPQLPVFASRSVNDLEWSRREVPGIQTSFLCSLELMVLTPLLSKDNQGHFHGHGWSELLIYVLSGRSISPVIVMFPLAISFPWGPEIAASPAASWGVSPKCSPGNFFCKYSQSKPNKVSESLYYHEGWELHTKIIFQNIKQKANSRPILII